MSQETLTWLNQNVLTGFTDKRGKAWHYRASKQGQEPNHYPGPIPVADVQRRLFHWSAAKGTASATWLTSDGVTTAEDDRRFPVGRPDTGVIFGYFADGYEIHQYQDWLLDKVATMLDGGLAIGSAGLLKNGAQAWVSVEVPDNVVTPEGAVFRPHLLACTSHDGSLATTYKRTVTNVVCDNTMGTALRDAGQVIKIKHSKHSEFRALDARQALDLVQVLADDFADEVKQLCRIEVPEPRWRDFLQAYVPEKETKRSRSIADSKRHELRRLWNFDDRVAPWKNTAWGVVQAVNTYEHHYATVRGACRAERNLSRAVTGKADALDQSTLDTLDKVLASA